MSPGAMLTDALAYAAHGWPVFPLHTPTGAGCSCEKPGCDRVGKHPRTWNGLKDATTNEGQIRAWWAKWPDANIGIATGGALLVLDVDAYKGGEASLAALLAETGEQLPESPRVLTGGGGWHLYLAQPEGLATPLGNSKGTKLGKAIDTRGDGGYVVAPPSLHASGGRYEWDASTCHLPLAPVPAWMVERLLEVKTAPRPEPEQRRFDPRPAGGGDLDRARRYLASMDPSISGEGGHNAALRAAVALVRGFNLSTSDALTLMLEDFNPRCSPPWTEKELRHKVEEAEAKGEKPWGYLLNAVREATPPAGVPRSSAPRPKIFIRPEEHEVNDAAIDALARIAEAEKVFQRGGGLVHVVRDVRPPRGMLRAPDAPSVAALPLPRLRELLAQAATWATKTATGEKPAHPPEWAVAGVAARGEWSGVPYLYGVTEAPILRPDGSIQGKAGYDEATGLLYLPHQLIDPVPEAPTPDDARRAIAELLEVVCDFPFGSDGDRSGWLAALLTPLARSAFEGPVPMFLADANTRGAGKTNLADAVGRIVTGRATARQAWSADNEETRKALMSIALAGDPLVLLDNVTGVLGNQFLDGALTSGVIADRLLKTNVQAKVPLRSMLFATGNNVQLNGDTARRTVAIRLVAREENPEDRAAFRHADLMGWIRQERPRLVRAALTVLRAHALAGWPSGKPIGSFEAWSRAVLGVFDWLGMERPRFAKVESDPERDALARLFAWLHENAPNGYGLTVRDLIRRAEQAEHEGMREALEDLAPLPPRLENWPKVVGKALSRARERNVGGLVLRCVDDRSAKVKKWLVSAP